jgi:hypothetical protein
MTDFMNFWPTARGARGKFSNPRQPAEKAWDKAIKQGADPDEIQQGWDYYLETVADEDGRYVCQTATFINQWRWQDYLEQAREQKEAREKREAERLPSMAGCLKRYARGHEGSRVGVEIPSHLTEDDVRACLAAGLIDAKTAAVFGVVVELREVTG